MNLRKHITLQNLLMLIGVLTIGFLLAFSGCRTFKKDQELKASEQVEQEKYEDDKKEAIVDKGEEETFSEDVFDDWGDEGGSGSSGGSGYGSGSGDGWGDEGSEEEEEGSALVISSETEGTTQPTTDPVTTENSTSAPPPEPAVPVEASRLEEFKVGIKSEDSMLVGQSYFVEVFIGKDSTQLRVSDNETSAWSSIPASLGQFTSVTLKASGSKFEILSAQKKCVQIDRSGSHLDFDIKPLEAGEIKLKAEINLYEDENCSDTPVPKVTEVLEIKVYAIEKDPWEGKGEEIFEITWAKFTEFWGALLALVFGLILFLLRKKFKKWFGFEEKES